jgi:phospholipid transport system substrate-binding protein
MSLTAFFPRPGLNPARDCIRDITRTGGHAFVLAVVLTMALAAGALPLAAQGNQSTQDTPVPVSVTGPETAVVLELQDGLVDILTNPAPMDTAARSAALTKLVQNTFDINSMGAVAVGRATYLSWTDEQRAKFLTAFSRFMVATHAARFEDAGEPDFEVEGSEDARSGRKVVHARYLRSGKPPVSIDYLVQTTTEGWRVLDVYLDETVSLLALHRAEFTSVLRAQGFDGFIAAMNAKSDELTPG